jgi:capsular polysaccharide biosynthesis protein
LNNVHLDTGAMTLIKDGYRLKETCYLVPPEVYEQACVIAHQVIKLDPGISYIMARNFDNYYHWTVQAIPAIDWSLRYLPVANFALLSGRLTKWQAETLAILGHDRVARIAFDTHRCYFVPDLDYSEFQNGRTSFEVSLSAQSTYRRLAASAINSSRADCDIVYLARTDTANRTVENEGEIIKLVESEGIQAVVPGSLSVERQINLFGKVDAVIGPHGAGMTNIVFCRPGSAVYEMGTTHYRNPCFARLAQSADLNYTIDLFRGSGDDCGGDMHSRRWTIDPDVVLRRIHEIKAHVASMRSAPVFVSEMGKEPGPTSPAPLTKHAGSSVTVPATAAAMDPFATTIHPANIGRLMLAFESLGDNGEFGLIQRRAGVEPLGLLRFSGIARPVEVRLDAVAVALARGFEGLGVSGTLTVYPDGQAAPREFLVRDSVYDLMYRTGIHEGELEADALRDREPARLAFLRRKLLSDLQTGEKIWVWKSRTTSDRHQVEPLLDVLRRFGPNTLLWAVEANDTHRPGTVERLDVDLIKGYVECFATDDTAADVRPAAWFEVCRGAFELYRQSPPRPEPEIVTAAAPAGDRFIRRLAEAADETITIERATGHRGRGHIRLGESLSRNQHGAAFAALAVTTSVQSHIIANATLDADTLLLLQDGRVIPEAVHYFPRDKAGCPDRGAERLIRLKGGQDVVLGYNNAHRSYRHWLTECLPAIDWSLRRERLRQVRLVLPALEQWQEDLLHLLGCDAVPRLTPAPDTRYCLPRLEYADFLSGRTSFGVCMSALDTARRILAAVPAAASPHRVLYVPCTNPHYGSIRNEAELADRLRQRGVHVIDWNGLSTAARINLFRHADAVIGPTGEGLADILFCKPGTLLWEWMPRHHLDVTFNRLAQAAAIDYQGDLFESVADPETAGLWDVDAEVLDRGLSEIFDRLAAQTTTNVTAALTAGPPRPLSAMEFLSHSRPDVPPSGTPAGTRQRGWLRRLFRRNARSNITADADQ